MPRIAALLLVLAGAFAPGLFALASAADAAAKASAAPATEDPFAPARAIVADLGRIVTPNGVQELFETDIGGLKQWVSIRGKDRDNPLLLFVHGGPASPSMPIAWTFQRPWEDFFTVVHWDQRGAGKTYRGNDPAQVGPTLRIDRYVDDTLELIALLQRNYGKRKVILVGHSWGTVIGLKVALRKPEWIHAYVGIGQVINYVDNETLSYEFAVRRAREENNAEALRELAAIAPYPGNTPITRERIIAARKWAQHYGGLAAYRDSFAYYFNAPKLSPQYDAADRAAINQGSLLTLERVMPELLATDFKPIIRVDFPVFMYMGRHDFSTPSAQAARWIARVQAPKKGAVWFEHSSHLAMMEEPGRVLLHLVQEVRPLAKDAEPLR